MYLEMINILFKEIAIKSNIGFQTTSESPATVILF